MNQKALVFILTLTALLFSLNGCSLKSENGSLSDAEKSMVKDSDLKPVTLNIWIMPNSQKPEEDFMNVVKPFLKDHPNIKIVPTVLGWDTAWKNIMLSVSGGTAPDITQLGSTWLAAIASTGELEDLSAKYNIENFVPQSLRMTVIENSSVSSAQRYAIPWFLDTRVLVYRKDVMNLAGIKPETDFSTWSKFKNALKKIKDSNLETAPMGMPGKNDWNIIHNFSPWIWGAGGDYLSKDFMKCTINSKESLMGIKFYVELANEGLIFKTALEKNTAEVNDMFNSGKFAVMITSPTSVGYSMNNNIGIAPLPAGPNCQTAFLGGSVLALYKSSKHPEEAIELLNYLSSTDTQSAYSKKTLYMPAVKAAYNNTSIISDQMMDVLKSQVTFSKTYPSITAWGPIENILKDGYSHIWEIVMGVYGDYDEQKVIQELDKMTNEINNELKKYN